MGTDDFDIRIIQRDGVRPTGVIDHDGRAITCEYDGDPADLIRIGIGIGKRLASDRPLGIPIIPDGPCD